MARVRKKIDLGGTTRRERIECDEPELPGPLPRVTRLMALSIRFDELLRSGKVRDQAHLAEIGGVSEPRISQILALSQLAPEIQESLLFLPRVTQGKSAITEKRLRPLVKIDDWNEQRKLWRDMGLDDAVSPG